MYRICEELFCCGQSIINSALHVLLSHSFNQGNKIWTKKVVYSLFSLRDDPYVWGGGGGGGVQFSIHLKEFKQYYL